MPLTAHGFSLTGLISAAVAPVVLISATAILWSGFANKYGNMSDRLRNLAAEFRHPDTPPARRQNLLAQIGLFHRRVIAMWVGSGLLSLALLSFLATVLLVVFAERRAALGVAGAVFLMLGLLLLTGAILMELHEVRLARLTMAGELSDIPLSTEK
jgi:hypothetical protein